jgi:hypothetical protein
MGGVYSSFIIIIMITLRCAAAAAAAVFDCLQHSEALIDEFIHFSMGGVYSSFMLGGLKVSSWAKRLLLRESSISQAVDTLHTVARVSRSQARRKHSSVALASGVTRSCMYPAVTIQQCYMMHLHASVL